MILIHLFDDVEEFGRKREKITSSLKVWREVLKRRVNVADVKQDPLYQSELGESCVFVGVGWISPSCFGFWRIAA